MKKRLREIDFLRGIAIILVLLRHQPIDDYTHTMGWMGVDLFFVLSGFLVSGLLFSEYSKYGSVDSKRFLIRRGFKIYPVYYITYILYLIPLLRLDKVEWDKVLYDGVFIQNYTTGWGYAYGASWSLAVEEHFYFGLCFLIWLITTKAPSFLKVQAGKRFSGFEIFLGGVMIVCLLLRILQNTVIPPDLPEKQITMTHLRIDSLLAGVYISFLYHFKPDALKVMYSKYKGILWIVPIVFLSWTPFIEPELNVPGKTIGLTLAFISFAIILVYFLLSPNVNGKLNRIFSKPLVSLVSIIGYNSYSIYVIHLLVKSYVSQYNRQFNLQLPDVVLFLLVSAFSVLAGIFLTKTIEKFFLNIRDKFYPRRSNIFKNPSEKPPQVW